MATAQLTISPAHVVKQCRTCAYWREVMLAVDGTIVAARCGELSMATMPDDWCPDWTSKSQTAAVIDRPRQPEPVKQVKPTKLYVSYKRQVWICEECGVKFTAKPSKNGVRRFCGAACYKAWHKRNPTNTGNFKKGQKPWNTGARGIHLSPATEFKPGHRPANYMSLGSTKICSQRNGSTRKQAYIKIAEPNTWKARALIIWEEHNGQLPDGMILWHKDGDSLNDDISNLEAITRAESLARIRKQLKDSGQLSKVAHKIWQTRRRQEEKLLRMSVEQLRRLGYRYYCPVCSKPYKTSKLTCHKKEEAMPL